MVYYIKKCIHMIPASLFREAFSFPPLIKFLPLSKSANLPKFKYNIIRKRKRIK